MVTLAESRDRILPLVIRDLRDAGGEGKFVQESPDGDPAKFFLDDKPARVNQSYSGFPVKIDLDWFKGSSELPVIQKGQFYWYVFDLTAVNKGNPSYFICSYLRMRSWVLEFDAPKGKDYRDQNSWGSNFKIPINGKPWFRWIDDPLDSPRNSGREITLNNVAEALSEGHSVFDLPFSVEDREFIEGKPKLVMHLRKERDSGAPQAKKDAFRLEHGKLFCERCNLDPVKEYGGEHGESCIEVHHTNPVAEMEPGHRTRLEDLQCLCASCHRVVHSELRAKS